MRVQTLVHAVAALRACAVVGGRGYSYVPPTISEGSLVSVIASGSSRDIVGCPRCASGGIGWFSEVKEPSLLVLFGDSNDHQAVKAVCANVTGGFNVVRLTSPVGGGFVSTHMAKDNSSTTRVEAGWELGMDLPWCDLTPTLRVTQLYHYGLSQGAWHDGCVLNRAEHHLPLQLPVQPQEVMPSTAQATTSPQRSQGAVSQDASQDEQDAHLLQALHGILRSNRLRDNRAPGGHRSLLAGEIPAGIDYITAEHQLRSRARLARIRRGASADPAAGMRPSAREGRSAAAVSLGVMPARRSASMVRKERRGMALAGLLGPLEKARASKPLPRDRVVLALTDSIAVAATILPLLVQTVTDGTRSGRVTTTTSMPQTGYSEPERSGQSSSSSKTTVQKRRRVRVVMQSSLWDANCALESGLGVGNWTRYLEAEWPRRALLFDAAVRRVDPLALWRTHPVYHNWLRKTPGACPMGAWLANEIPAMNRQVEALFGTPGSPDRQGQDQGQGISGQNSKATDDRVVPWGRCGVCEGTCAGPAGCCNQHGAKGSYHALFGLIASHIAKAP